MRIFLTGVGCIGKTTIGGILAEMLSVPFFDLDDEIERYFDTSIERLHNRWLTPYSYSLEAAKVLSHLLSRDDSSNCVVALPPSGLMRGFWRVVKQCDCITVALSDRPENIVERITFYDIDSNPIEKKLTPQQKESYRKEIKKDATYFRRSYKRANLRVDITDMDAEQAARHVKESLENISFC